ncbi:TetR/AcrR family transcriptional regulator [Streptomyces antimycoticus]|uniref:TetR/AcrR family transcriptional regulator n=3 Tax=Streptomyces TaxID=1883 RepID=A0ABD5JA81_9ACTN|nr:MULTISPECIES: TetR/AcrR family transcriptional regulator [Streptomyces]MEE4585292.1 TetR/AcrR family transcriptional regulator [Streptomyces sp. DSM 41602]KUL50426.1 TetR family transcriptional regulator [Streptomyces violaceusniger]QTI89216.1 TetR family transcriptional regulator [Streptomyces sp. AgN23]RSS45972.1 TetR/AcrR family transcriptional regulator [Streptomyces sp. WAC05858]WJD97504.1 TetR/AcrR family transcriptional regulator [Streptomyces antimycoticus]
MSDQPPKNIRLRDAVRTQAEILDVATREFAERGYAGARVDEIAALTRTTKRMIYYYFGGKEQLYVKVLERAYTGIREAEQAVDVTGLDPAEAIRHLAELTFDHHTAHADFIRLVSIENIHRAEHLVKSETLAKAGTPVIDLISGILARGREQGVFRDDTDAVDVHMMISSFAVFPVANQYTFGTLFGRDPLDPERRAHYRRMLGDMVVAYLSARS